MTICANDDLHAARRLAVNEYCAASVRGDEAAVAGLLSELVQIELWSGNWQRAGALASRCSRAAASVAARTTGAEARYAGDAARAGAVPGQRLAPVVEHAPGRAMRSGSAQ